MIQSIVFCFILMISYSLHALDAVYELPYPELDQSLTSFKIDTLDILQGPNRDFVSFALPRGMTGRQLPPLIFSGKLSENGEGLLSSEYGELRCEKPQEALSQVKCTVRYNQEYRELLSLAYPGLIKALSIREMNSEDFKRRVDVLERFSGDPIGVLLFHY